MAHHGELVPKGYNSYIVTFDVEAKEERNLHSVWTADGRPQIA